MNGATESKRMLSGKSNAVPIAAMLRTGDGLPSDRRKKDNFYKGHLDVVLKENMKMKGRLEAVEKENVELKRAVAELSQMLGRKGPIVGAFDVEKMLRGRNEMQSTDDVAAAVGIMDARREDLEDESKGGENPTWPEDC